MRKTICNECRYTFALKEESIETECIDIDRKIERQFLKCPNCGHKYTILITDQPMRDMINQRRAIQIRVAQLMNGKNRIRKYKELKKQYMNSPNLFNANNQTCWNINGAKHCGDFTYEDNKSKIEVKNGSTNITIK